MTMVAVPGKAADVVLDVRSVSRKSSLTRLQSETSQVDDNHPEVGQAVRDDTEIGDPIGSEAPVTGDASMAARPGTKLDLGTVARITIPSGSRFRLDGVAFLNAGMAAAAGHRGAQLIQMISAIDIPPQSQIASITLVLGSQLISFARRDYELLRRGITALMRRALSPVVPSEDGLENLLRSVMVWAAEQARVAFLETGEQRVVEEFAQHWLGFSMTGKSRETMVDAVLEVLLDASWTSAADMPVLPGHTQLRGQLRRRTEVAHRRWKPITAGRINGQMISGLNEPVQLRAGETVELLDVLPGDRDVEEEVARRLYPKKSIFDKLSAIDIEVACQVMQGLSWPEAAAVVGQPGSEGRNFRRRIQRRAQELVARERARARTVAL